MTDSQLNEASFNSIKVQLRRGANANNSVTSDFQFHKGTIKASLEWRYVCKYPLSIP